VRILFVSAHYPPDLGACATRVRELCTSWAAEGHEVHVLCGLPNHPTGVVPPEYRGHLVKREVVDGVHVHRTWIYATPNSGTVRRSVAFGSFALSAVTVGQRGIPQPDVLIATSPQFLTALAGAFIARQRGVPLVAEIRDLWPASVWEVGALPRHHPIIKVLEQVERWLYRESDLVVVVSPSFQQAIARATGQRAQDVPVITNGVQLDRWDPALDGAAVRRRFGLPQDATLAVYAGTHGMSHGLETVLQAARQAPEVQFVLVGEGARKQDLVEQGRDIDNVTFLPGQPAQAMPEIYAMATSPWCPCATCPCSGPSSRPRCSRSGPWRPRWCWAWPARPRTSCAGAGPAWSCPPKTRPPWPGPCASWAPMPSVAARWVVLAAASCRPSTTARCWPSATWTCCRAWPGGPGDARAPAWPACVRPSGSDPHGTRPILAGRGIRG